MRTVGSIEIDRPIEAVFRLTNEHLPKWSIVVAEEEVLNETVEGVETTFRSVHEEVELQRAAERVGKPDEIL